MRQLIGGGKLTLRPDSSLSYLRTSDLTGYSTTNTSDVVLTVCGVPADYDDTQWGAVFIHGIVRTSGAGGPAVLTIEGGDMVRYPGLAGAICYTTGGQNFYMVIPVRGGDYIYFYGRTSSGYTMYLDEYSVYAVDVGSSDKSPKDGVSW